jgi:DNA-binding LacI/PurR family transcriptional regulator
MRFRTDEHVYKQMAAELRRDIQSRRLIDKIPGERELSERYNVNFKTANKAVALLVNAGLLCRVKGKGTFVVQPRAKKKLSLIGLSVPELDNPYFARTVQAIERAAARESISVLLHTPASEREESSFIRSLEARGADGLITYNAAVLSEASRLPFPVAGFGAGSANGDYVSADVLAGARLVTEHLVDRFGTSVAYVGVTDSPGDDRVHGYRETLNAAKAPAHKALLCVGDNNYRGGFNAAKKLLATQRPRAIFFYNDYMAMGGERAIAELGLRVPQDIAVAGFDDSVDPSDMVVPTTSVLFSFEKTADALLRLLKRRLAQPDACIEQVRIAPVLRVRKSTAVASRK